MASQSRLTLLIEAKNRAKRAIRGAQRQFSSFSDRIRAKFQSVRKTILSWRRALAAVAGAATLIRFGKAAFDLGSSVEETASKFRTVFGPAVGEVNDFLDDFAAKAGLSRKEAQEVAATTGAIAQGMGFATEESARFTEEIIRLSGDLTSFNNIPIEETSRAIQAALAGEREQLKRLGIVIRETDVQERALAESGKEAAAALTQQEKATATLALISEKAGVAVGDLERTQNSAANRARRIAAEFRTLREVIAAGLLPVFDELLTLMDRLNFIEFAAALETDIGQAFLNLGIVAGAKMGEGIFRGLETVLRETNVLSRIPGPVGELFDRINLAAGAAGEVADIAADSARQASEAITILAESGGSLEAVVQSIRDAREGLAEGGEGGGAGGGEGGAGALTATLPDLESEFAEIEARAEIFGETIDVAAEKADVLRSAFLDLVAQGFDPQHPALQRLLADYRELAGEAIPNLEKVEVTQSRLSGLMSEVARSSQMSTREMIADFREMGLSAEQMAARLEIPVERVRELMGEMQNVVQSTNQAVQSALIDTFTALGESLGQALSGASEAFSSLGNAIKTILGNLMQTVGKAMIAFGVAGEAIKKFITNPVLAIAAGTALVALGTALAASASGAVDSAGQALAGGGSAGASASAGASFAASQAGTANQPPATIVIEGGLLDMNDPRQSEALREAMEQLSGRRVVIREG